MINKITGHQPQGDRLSGSLSDGLEKGLLIRDTCTYKSQYCVIMLHVYRLILTQEYVHSCGQIIQDHMIGLAMPEAHNYAVIIMSSLI